MQNSGRIISGREVGHPTHRAVAGVARVLEEPLSFLAVDPATGRIIDRHHPQVGQSIAAVILVMPGTRGGSVTPSQFCETLRLGAGPIAICLPLMDGALAVGSIVAHRLYAIATPVFLIEARDYAQIKSDEWLRLEPQDLKTRAD